jgi:hypothetical protein
VKRLTESVSKERRKSEKKVKKVAIISEMKLHAAKKRNK